jgi:hypothetical protein
LRRRSRSGLGRVDAIRRRDGRWVVVTTKGLIVARLRDASRNTEGRFTVM